MQIANVMVALGGDKGTTVFKPGVTVSEIAVLIAIHGADAVFDIDPIGEEDRSDREEVSRLIEIYGRARGGDGNVEIVKEIFPSGVRSPAFKTLDELHLDESLFKPTARATAPAAKPGKKPKKGEAASEPSAPSDDIGLFDE